MSQQNVIQIDKLLQQTMHESDSCRVMSVSKKYQTTLALRCFRSLYISLLLSSETTSVRTYLVQNSSVSYFPVK